MRFWNTHLFKEHITHVCIEMLSRMYNYFLYFRRTAKNTTDHRRFNKLRTGTNNCYNFHNPKLIRQKLAKLSCNCSEIIK